MQRLLACIIASHKYTFRQYENRHVLTFILLKVTLIKSAVTSTEAKIKDWQVVSRINLFFTSRCRITAYKLWIIIWRQPPMELQNNRCKLENLYRVCGSKPSKFPKQAGEKHAATRICTSAWIFTTSYYQLFILALEKIVLRYTPLNSATSAT